VLAFLNLGPLELVLIAVVAVLVFGKDLPQAASRAYLQVRKLRGALDDLRRDSGIERELREIERTVREAEWEARRAPTRSEPVVPRQSLPAPPPAGAPAPEIAPAVEPPPAEPPRTPPQDPPTPGGSTNAASC
jgi:Sec-independent protein translocase protein TatA